MENTPVKIQKNLWVHKDWVISRSYYFLMTNADKYQENAPKRYSKPTLMQTYTVELMLSSVEKLITGKEAQEGHYKIEESIPQGHLILDQETWREFLIREMIGVITLALVMFHYRRKEALQEYLIDIIQFISIQDHQVPTLGNLRKYL